MCVPPLLPPSLLFCSSCHVILQEKEEDKQLKADAEEVVRCINDLTKEMEEYPDLLWDALDKWTAHEALQDAIEACEQRNQKIFERGGGNPLTASLQDLERKGLDEYDSLAERFDESYQQLCAAVKKYNDVCV